MRVRSLLSALVLLAGTTAWAHLPVLTADPVWSKDGAEVVLDHGYGHPAEAKYYDCAKPSEVTVYSPNGFKFDATPGLESYGAPGQLKWRTRFTPIQKGDHLAVLKCRSRIGKTLFDDAIKIVVHAGGASRGWWQKVGAPVEFVPLTRPYALPKGSSFRARLLFDGKPVRGTIVGVEHLSPEPPAEKLPSELHGIRQELTNAQGEFSVTLPEEGWYVIFANLAKGTVEEGGETLNLKARGSFLVRVGW